MMGRNQPYTAQREGHSRQREHPGQRPRGRNKHDLFQKKRKNKGAEKWGMKKRGTWNEVTRQAEASSHGALSARQGIWVLS